MLDIAYDMTPYMLNPYGGISRVCYNTYKQAALSPDIAPHLFSTGKIRFPDPALPPVKTTAGQKLFGKRYTIAHSLNHRLLPVKARRSVYTIHDVWSLRPNSYQPPSFQKKLAARITRDLKQADLIVAISETTLDSLLELNIIPPEKCRFVHIGAEKMIAGESVEDNSVKTVLNKKYALFVGCLEYRKNISHVLEAVLPLNELSLVIAGSPGFGYDKIEKQLRSFPQNRLFQLHKGSRNDLAHLYTNAAALILPSWEEGFGLPLVEAMSLGCPVITSNRSANAEIGGEAAMLVNPEEPRETTGYLRRLLDDAEFALSRKTAGFRRAGDFSWERYFQKLTGLYRELL